MTGIVGFVDPDPSCEPGDLLKQMVAAVRDSDRYRADFYCAGGVALGRVHLGVLDRTSQPIWNEDHSMCIVFEGELYGHNHLKQELMARGHQFTGSSDAELVLHLYEDAGEQAFAVLNGAFMLALWDCRERVLLVVNDRIGLRPVYYAAYGGRFAFGCGVRGLLADPRLPRDVDYVAIGQALHYEYALEDRTYLTAVKVLPPATIIRVCDGKPSFDRYWSLDYPEQLRYSDHNKHFADLLDAMRQALRRQLTGGTLRGINLSGGLDSRMLLGLVAEQEDPSRYLTYTFGLPGSDDVRVARQLAQVAGAAHTSFELAPDYLIQAAPIGVRIADGMESCVHMHALAHVRQQAQQVGVIYTGFYIDALISPDAPREWLAHYDDETSLDIMYKDIDRLFKKLPHKDFFTPAFRAVADEGMRTSFKRATLETKCHLLSDWQTRFELHNRQRRFTQFGNDLLRWQVECRNPFCDKDLIDLCLQLPAALRLDRYLFREVLMETFRGLAKVPLDRTGLPMVNDTRYLGIQINRHVRWHLHNRGIGKAPIHQVHPYARYDLWLRNELRSWAEAILLDERMLGRGIYEPKAVCSMVERHMNGQTDFSREMGMMLSIELWHRMYID